MAAKKWDMAASVASHLVKVEPKEAGWWINLAFATRRAAEVHIEKIRDGILSFSVLPK